MNEDTKKIDYLVCPVCKGNGFSEGKPCKNCKGLSLGAFVDGYFFYFDLILSFAGIKAKQFKKAFDRFVDFLITVFILTGLASLGWWIFNNWPSNVLINFSELFFWQKSSWFLVIFWVSMIFLMFAIYRHYQKIEADKKIVKLKYKKEVKTLPNNWAELLKSNIKINIAPTFSLEVEKVLDRSLELASSGKFSNILPAHIFAALLIESKQINAIFYRLNIDQNKLLEKFKHYYGSLTDNKEIGCFNVASKQLLIEAYIDAYNASQEKVKAVDLLMPLLKNDEKIKDIFYDLEIDADKLINTVVWFRINDLLTYRYENYRKLAKFKPSSNMDRAYTAVATPFLDNFSYDLTLAAKWGRLDLCIGREKEINNIFEAINSGRTACVLVGEEGVGRKSIINGLAQLMVMENVPEILQDKRLVELDIARLLGGSPADEAQKKMLMVINEVASAGNIILFIKDIENITGITSGGEESLDLAKILVNALDRRIIFCFATCSSQNYNKYLDSKPLGQSMFKIEVNEPEKNQAIQIIESKIAFFEGKYGVYFSYDSLENAVSSTSKYMHDKYLPEKAINVLELAASKMASSSVENKVITKIDIANVVSEITHIPVSKVSESESKTLLSLEDKIHQRMIGQEDAVSMVAASLRRARAELREGKRPIANFLFLGPTGTGKTELAKSVAEVYFSREDYMIRLDMSEYQHPDSIVKMIGSPESLGYLTESVRKSPFSLILLDEVEKAHPDILNLFLQVMDDGRLTDGQGRTVDFTNSIIIATSNIGALYIQEQVKLNTNLEIIKQEIINNQLNKVMRPELINRFDGIVVFKPLNEDNVIAITKIMLSKMAKLLETKGIFFKTDENGVKILAQQGFQPEFGARPLRRLIQDKIENIIANKILANEVKRRDTVFINNKAEIEIIKGVEL